MAIMNELYGQRKSALIEEVTAAFDGVSREGGVSLSESWVIDNYGGEEARLAARSEDSETRCQDVPDEGIANGYSCLSFLDEIGFRYYIPAYIVWFLRHIDNQDIESPACASNTFEFLLFGLGGIRGSELDEFYLSRFRLFTVEQSRAIAHFLVFAAQTEEAMGRLVERDLPQEQIDAVWAEVEGIRAWQDLPEGADRLALERYWGHFL